MKNVKLIIILAAVFAAVIPAVYADIDVISFHDEVVDAQTGTVTVQWIDSDTNTIPLYAATLVYGAVSGVYTGSIPEDIFGMVSFNPASEGMAAGIYYFRVSTTAIGQAMSNEYRLFIGKATGLGVSFITISPNPFSPDKGGLKISYMPESDNKTSVKITIKVFTMAGKYIATVVPGQMRLVRDMATDMWDGKTELGYYAKNGRYIIQLVVKDSTGEKQYLNTVVMVK